MQKIPGPVLIIGAQWPEPQASAAGQRMLQLVKAFTQASYTITFACVADLPENNALPAHVSTCQIELNNPSFDAFLKKLNPEMVLFDRFFMEEQFGWRVAQACPKALRILDTEDLHFLRNAREKALKNHAEADFNTEAAFREIAAMYRCDLSIVISKKEIELLISHFHFPERLLLYLPFMIDEINETEINKLPKFKDRYGFLFIGNFKHLPNVDSATHLVNKLFPEIRKQLKDAELNIYGAYVSPKVKGLHNPKQGIFVKGWVADANEAMQSARICLAPLRFGAGQKGKLLEAMQNGTPSITTAIGAEGMCFNEPWGGHITTSDAEFIEKAIELYSNEQAWEIAQQNGFKILNSHFSFKKYAPVFINRLEEVVQSLSGHRASNFTGSMLQYHRVQATKYLSKWIEEKNKKFDNQ